MVQIYPFQTSLRSSKVKTNKCNYSCFSEKITKIQAFYGWFILVQENTDVVNPNKAGFLKVIFSGR